VLDGVSDSFRALLLRKFSCWGVSPAVDASDKALMAGLFPLRLKEIFRLEKRLMFIVIV
jgi:hypothetical protein